MCFLKINFVRNKCELIIQIIENNIGIPMTFETKLDSSFPNGQFQIDGYSVPCGFDKNVNRGGILVFIREDIPTKLIESQMKINSKKEKVAFVLFLRS